MTLVPKAARRVSIVLLVWTITLSMYFHSAYLGSGFDLAVCATATELRLPNPTAAAVLLSNN
jgi:hypothetical protein